MADGQRPVYLAPFAFIQLLVYKNSEPVTGFSPVLLEPDKESDYKTTNNAGIRWTSKDCESSLPPTERIYFCMFDKKDKNANFPH